MTFRGDERGVTVQIGAVLLLGILVVLMSVYQVSVVPDQNRGVEFRHSQSALADLENLRNAILTASSTESPRPVSVSLGTTYPTRTIFVNPPPARGSLRTAGTRSLTLSNARATGEETGDYLDGSAIEYETTSLRYDPGYNAYADAPETVYENTLVYNSFPNGGNLTETDQTLIDGKRLNLVALQGELSENGFETSVDPTAASAARRTVPVRATGGGNVTLRVPSSLPESRWDDLLDDEMTDAGGYVADVERDGSDIVITLADGETYELRTALVGVGAGVRTPEAAYITDGGGTNVSIVSESTIDLTAEVRDRYNNPVSGVPVSASVSAGTVVEPPSATDAEGRTTAVYRAPTDGTATVTLRIKDGAPSNETVTYEVDVVDGGSGDDGTGSESGGNASALYDVRWDASATDARDGVRYTAANDTLRVNRSVASSTLPMLANVTDAGDGDPVEGVALDFATNDSTVADFSAGSGTSNATGQFGLDASLADGSTNVYVASGGAGGDRLRLEVVSGPGDVGGGGSPSVSMRVDDTSLVDTDRTEYLTSYDVGNANSSFRRVEIEYSSPSLGTTARSSTRKRGRIDYANDYTTGESHDLTLNVIYDDGSGEYVAASRTVSDAAADARNPAGNDNLGNASTATLRSSTLSDTSSNSGPQYTVDYALSGTGSYSQVQLVMVGTENNAGKDVRTFTASRSEAGVVLSTYGKNKVFKVGVLVYGPTGAVVDDDLIIDQAKRDSGP